jgi:subtilisin family serine protease
LPLKRLTSEASTNLTKIAVLDTGAHFNADIADLYDDRIEAHCFLQDSLAPQPLQGDEDGHGTHMASIILDVSTACKVYTARIVRHRDEMRVDTNKREVATRIAKVGFPITFASQQDTDPVGYQICY